MTDTFNTNSLKEKFTHVFETNGFNGDESKSGVGSGSEQTRIIRTELPILLDKYGIQSMVDAPCGDMFWMIQVLQNASIHTYTGIDIVPELIRVNTEKFASDQIRFLCADITQADIPRSDLILCRDCLVHLSYEDAKRALQNMKNSGSRYLLTTHFRYRTQNADLGKGFWRSVNLTLEPFNFPEPIDMLVELATEADNKFYDDKTLSLWNLQDIKL